ncbi:MULTISPECIES: hypothetical protein [unclassified Streptomyces]|uniref:hypothetical protein n=1 Tax=unclassified Streptomyces TaxID=2593676 RepID=UPI002E1DD0E9|nr:hypothetical protein OG760_37815 [Streptomyces sp. NBC_00963]
MSGYTAGQRPRIGQAQDVRAGAWWVVHPGRAVLAAVVMLLLALITSLLLAGSAGADDTSPVPGPTPGLTPAGPANLLPPASPSPSGTTAPATPAPPTSTPSKPSKGETEKERLSQFDKRVAQYKKDRRNGGVLSAFEVTDRDGNPVSSYRVFSDTGSWKDWDLHIDSFLVENLFLASKWLVSFACFLIAWSLSFKLAGLLLKPALAVSTSLYSNVMVQLGLPSLFLTYAGTVAAWHFMFGNRVRGWGETAAALVISALALTTFAAPPTMLLSEQSGAVGTTRQLATEVAALVLQNEETPKGPATMSGWETVSAARLARPITDELVDAFVVRPAMLLSYGQTFDGKCAKSFRDSRIRQAVLDAQVDDAVNSKSTDQLKKLPWIGSLIPDASSTLPDSLRDLVQGDGPVKDFEKTCVKGDTGALKKASVDKVGGAAFMTFAAFLVCLFIVIVAGAFLMSQVWIAFEAMIARVAFTVGVLPGPGRAWLWARGASVLKSLALMVLSVVSLAVLIVVIKAILNTPEKDLPGGLTVRFIVIDILCIGGFIFRKRLTATTKKMAMRARARIGSSPLGGAAPADLGQQSPKGHLGRRLAVGALMLGAMAATGGTGAAAMGTTGGVRGSAALAARLSRSGGRAIGGTVKAAASTTGSALRGGVALGKVGLKSTVGLPVYGPRAARLVGSAARQLPAQASSAVSGGVQQLQQRLTDIQQRYVHPAQNFTGEYTHNLRSLGRLVTGRSQQGPYIPRHRPLPPPASRRSTVPAAGVPAHPPFPAPAPAPAPVPPARRRPVPARVPQPPASTAQAALQQRLHRIRTRQAATSPHQPTPPAAPAVRPPRARPAPRRGGRP